MSEKTLLVGFSQVVTVDPDLKTPTNPLGVIEEGIIGIENNEIAWIGTEDDLPEEWEEEADVWDQSGMIALPGLIDCHTHPVFAGDRADELEQLLRGKTHLEIAKAGGGIFKTIQATRETPFEDLVTLTYQRISESMRFGVTTMEAKSGYGLTLESELKSLEVLDAVSEELPIDILPTFMGAHDIAPEFKNDTAGYVDYLCQTMIPAIAEQGIAQFCDVFCEAGYFDVAQSRRILECGLAHGLQPRIHAEQFSDVEGAMMGASLGALSADHLLHLSDKGIAALAKSNTVATLLPGTAFFLRLNRYAPARKLLDAGVRVALATDFNPGSSMTQNIQLMMTLGCLQMGMLPHEVIEAVTLNAAHALGKGFDRGSLTVGKRADIACFSVPDYATLLYHYGVNHLTELWIEGAPVLMYETTVEDDSALLN